jgi:hypothetical protein
VRLRSLVVALLVLPACEQRATPRTRVEPAGAGQRSMRVPAGLRLARALDTLTVTFDPAAMATTEISVDPGLFVGLETTARVFPLGGTRPTQAGGTALSSPPSFDGTVAVYDGKTQGLPVPGTRYVAEVTVVLFETDVPPQHEWSPRSDRYEVLWTRTLRQAEE